ncbi:Versiconal hemiacetal acetate esterase [Lecanosticta acicola]|uniref:Versiconal hemiacetal acetate esterase n=1 Tax=Lecanosticta acicola TaxID=111012 RepID=A0AAI8YRN2_9PEZI|nr:Versiconal hemiacetal acetate esterase [Lecanosticta acicola]
MPREYAQSWLEWEAASGGRAVLKGTVEEIRAMSDNLSQALLPMLPPFTDKVTVQESEIEGTKVRIYNPKGTSGPLPTAIWTHGGGYMLGDLDTDHHLCGLVSEQTKSVVVNVDYRLAPEAVWPAQLEDCVKVYKWAHRNAPSFSSDPQKFYTIGGSAGGALALQTANQILRDPDPALRSSLKGICALVPSTAHWYSIPSKYASTYTAYSENASGVPIIDRESMEIFFKAVKADPQDPSLFTLLATDIHPSFPPTYFASCEFDPLRDDAFVMEAALRDAGVPTRHDHYKGFPHYFWIIPAVPEGREFIGKLMDGVRWLLGQM